MRPRSDPRPVQKLEPTPTVLKNVLYTGGDGELREREKQNVFYCLVLLEPTPTVIQSGDPDVIFPCHASCKDYGVSKYDSLYCSKALCLILAAACNNLLLHTPLKHLTHEQSAQSTTLITSMLGGSPVEEPAHRTCKK